MRSHLITTLLLALLATAAACGEGQSPGAELAQADAGLTVDSGQDEEEGVCWTSGDCVEGQVCIATESGAAQGECALRCEDGRDICPNNEQCVHVVDADGNDAAACLAASFATTDAWQGCDDDDAVCGSGQRCVSLGLSYGAFCLPDCLDGDCEVSGGACALSWRQGEERFTSCVHPCVTDADCPGELGCRVLAGVGVCLQ